MDAVEVARQYLKDRPVTASHRGSVLRAAGRVGSLEAGTINAYLNRRLSERSTITVRTERSILLTLWRYAWENDLVAAPPKGCCGSRRESPRREHGRPSRSSRPSRLQSDILAGACGRGRRSRCS
jgi:hypothetical protein